MAEVPHLPAIVVTPLAPPLTADEIRAFAADFDPQPVHLDEEAAQATVLGGLSASGWQSCLIACSLIEAALRSDGWEVVLLRVEEVRWKRPVRPGDTLRADGHLRRGDASDLVVSDWTVRAGTEGVVLTLSLIHQLQELSRVV